MFEQRWADLLLHLPDGVAKDWLRASGRSNHQWVTTGLLIRKPEEAGFRDVEQIGWLGLTAGML